MEPARSCVAFRREDDTHHDESDSSVEALRCEERRAESNAERMAAALEPRHGPLTVVPA